MNTLLTRVPVAQEGDILIALLVGTPEVSLGDVVTIKDATTLLEHRDVFVREVLVTPLNLLPQEVITLFGFRNFTELRKSLSAALSVSMPAEAQVTVVITADPETDLYGDYEEDADADNPENEPLGFSLEDEEDDDLSPEHYLPF